MGVQGREACSNALDQLLELHRKDLLRGEHRNVLVRGEGNGTEGRPDTTLGTVPLDGTSDGLAGHHGDLGLALYPGAHDREHSETDAVTMPEQGIEVPPSRETGGRA